MPDFYYIINNYINNISNLNEKKIIEEAINLIESKPVILDEELKVLNEFFLALKKGYTLNILNDPNTLDFCVAIVKKKEQIRKNNYSIEILFNELQKESLKRNISQIESTVLSLLLASEYLEENEILLIQNIIYYLNNNWTLRPMETNEQNIKYSRLIPVYSKQMIKK